MDHKTLSLDTDSVTSSHPQISVLQLKEDRRHNSDADEGPRSQTSATSNSTVGEASTQFKLIRYITVGEAIIYFINSSGGGRNIEMPNLDALHYKVIRGLGRQQHKLNSYSATTYIYFS